MTGFGKTGLRPSKDEARPTSARATSLVPVTPPSQHRDGFYVPKGPVHVLCGIGLGLAISLTGLSLLPGVSLSALLRSTAMAILDENPPADSRGRPTDVNIVETPLTEVMPDGPVAKVTIPSAKEDDAVVATILPEPDQGISTPAASLPATVVETDKTRESVAEKKSDSDIDFGAIRIDPEHISDPTVRDAVQRAMTLAGGDVDAATWATEKFGYVPRKLPGDTLPEAVSREGIPLLEKVNLSGRATVISPDRISVSDKTFRLSGIVVPDLESSCSGSDGVSYDCLAWAVNGVGSAINGKDVYCEAGNMAGDEPIGQCEVMAADRFIDISAWMVSAGIALASTDGDSKARYGAEEASALQARRGIWSGSFSIAGREFSPPMAVPDFALEADGTAEKP